jgi:hypothetical protein
MLWISVMLEGCRFSCYYPLKLGLRLPAMAYILTLSGNNPLLIHPRETAPSSGT